VYRGKAPAPGEGRPIVLFFWATWCRACKEALPGVLDVFHHGSADVVAITDESPDVLDAFFARLRREFPRDVARDPGRQTIFRFGVRSLPSFVLLDARGAVASEVVGDPATLEVPSAR
jgi:thiol-disulfide isomerase/thioredoxin